VKDFFSEEQPKNYGDMYKNFAGLIETVNSNVLCKLDGKDGGDVAGKTPDATAKNTDAESSSSMHRYTVALILAALLHLHQSKFYLLFFFLLGLYPTGLQLV
jgi:hypothetical protein